MTRTRHPVFRALACIWIAPTAHARAPTVALEVDVEAAQWRKPPNHVSTGSIFFGGVETASASEVLVMASVSFTMLPVNKTRGAAAILLTIAMLAGSDGSAGHWSNGGYVQEVGRQIN